MKKLLIGIAVLAVCFVSTGCGQGGDIVGTWKEEYFEKTCPIEDDMQNHQIVFNDDGTFSDGRGVNVDGHYKVLSFEDSYGSNPDSGYLKLSRISYLPSEETLFIDKDATAFYEKQMTGSDDWEKKPLIDAPPGKFDEGLTLTNYARRMDNREFSYKLLGNKLYIMSKKVNVEKGSMVSGIYTFVR